MELKVIREDVEITGFFVSSAPETLEEIFCETFPGALVSGEATIEFGDDEIIFNHPTCKHCKKRSLKVDPNDLKAIQALLREDAENNNLVIEREPLSLTQSFQIRKAK